MRSSESGARRTTASGLARVIASDSRPSAGAGVWALPPVTALLAQQRILNTSHGAPTDIA